MAYTKGFNDPSVLTLKFTKHGALLGVNTEAEYLEMADTFLGGPRDVRTVAECTRASDKCLLRFNHGAQLFGVLPTTQFIRTFYKFDPPPRNAKWFQKQCAS